MRHLDFRRFSGTGDIDQEGHRIDWMFGQKESILQRGVRAGCNFLLSCSVRKADVNWEHTIGNYIEELQNRETKNGQIEIFAHSPEKIMNFKAEPFQRKHTEP